jgi:hypothetical protein
MLPIEVSKPKGNQKLVEKYTKLVLKRLYDEDCYVFFIFPVLTGSNTVVPAMFFRKDFPPTCLPTNSKGFEDYFKNPKYSIVFDSRLLSPTEKSVDYIWGYIVHETTHFEVSTVFNKKGIKNKHTQKFYARMRRNEKRVSDLKEKFKKEIEGK